MSRRDAVAEDLRALADDLKRLYESATTDPKKLKWKERRWRMLEGAVGAVATLAARRLVIKLWGILTGEEAPKKPPTEPRRGEVHASRPAQEQAAPEPAVSTQTAPEQPWPGEPPQAERPLGPPFTEQPQAESEDETMSSSSSSVK